MLLANIVADTLPSTDVLIRRPADIPPVATGDVPGMNDPAARFARVYASDILSMFGATGVSYGSRDRTIVRLRFESLEMAKIADAALKDVVLGASLVYADPKGNPWDMSAPYAGSLSNVARTVAAMPGVVAYRWYGSGDLLFTADTIERRVKLQQLVERRFGTATAYWKGECFGPGCTPDPAPPTGEV